MKFAIHIHTFGPYADPRLAADLAALAETSGWDAAFVSDHIVWHSGGRPRPLAEPWVTMAAMAAATRRVLIGPMVAPLPRRRPWQIAAEAVTLDHLSKGRLVLGVGSGIGAELVDLSEEHDQRVRAAMLDDALAIVDGLWSGEPVHHHGRYYRLDGVVGLPRPVQRPRIPIWVGGHWPHSAPFRRAARWDGVFVDGPDVDWMAGEIITPADLRASVDFTLSHRSATDPFDVVIGGTTPMDLSVARERLRPYPDAGATWWVEAITEGFGAPEVARVRIAQGPPRI